MRKKKEPKAYNWDAKIMAALRKVWRFSPERREALDLVRYPNDKKIVRCVTCGWLVNEKLAKVDHIKPIVPVSGFDSWDAVIHRLRFEELQVLCEECHKLKTKAENAERAKYRKLQKACRKAKKAAEKQTSDEPLVLIGLEEMLTKCSRKEKK